MAKGRKAAGSKSKIKTVASRKPAAKSAVRSKGTKGGATPAKRAMPKAVKQPQKLKLKIHRPKESAVKTAGKAKEKAALKRLQPKAQAKPLTKAVNRKEQRLATLKAVG